MAWLKLAPLFLLFTSSAFAQTLVYKYQIASSFGIGTTCEVRGETERSQVRIYIKEELLQSNQDFVLAQVKVTACIWGGNFLKESYDLAIPRFFFTPAETLNGAFELSEGPLAGIVIKQIQQNQWRFRYFKDSKTAWNQINPIEFTMNPEKNHPQQIRFFVPDKNKWIEADLRLIEVDDE
ncbi:hypothetical protein [Bdellovibrio sp. HCB-110]|uniref:hypothetical protein n=1 Tax=Bdellovibrio sp. HCB-110 TaxID=3391182 RepID=UPI0039B4E914